MFYEVCSQTSFFPLSGESPQGVLGDAREASPRQGEQFRLEMKQKIEARSPYDSCIPPYFFRRVFFPLPPSVRILYVPDNSPVTFRRNGKK